MKMKNKDRTRNYREIPSNRSLESERQSQRNRDARDAMSPEESQRHRDTQGQRRTLNAIDEYKGSIKKGPTQICISCGETWFTNQVRGLNRNIIAAKFPRLDVYKAFYLAEKFPSVSNSYLFCFTCRRSISSDKMPNICLSEGFDFPAVPDCLKNLASLEERLISLRIPFMRIISLGYERQCAVRGAVVNVPVSV